MSAESGYISKMVSLVPAISLQKRKLLEHVGCILQEQQLL